MSWLAAQVFATCALVGLIWTVQLVHYPLFAEVRHGFARYHDAHCTRIAWLVAPLMAVELLTATALALAPPAGVPPLAARTGLLLVVVVWAATALLSVPAHARLGRGYDAAQIRRLVSTNWIRTLAWSARAVLVLWMFVQSLESRGPVA